MLSLYYGGKTDLEIVQKGHVLFYYSYEYKKINTIVLDEFNIFISWNYHHKPLQKEKT